MLGLSDDDDDGHNVDAPAVPAPAPAPPPPQPPPLPPSQPEPRVVSWAEMQASLNSDGSDGDEPPPPHPPPHHHTSPAQPPSQPPTRQSTLDEMAGVIDVRVLSDELGVSSALYLGAQDMHKLQDVISNSSDYVQTERAPPIVNDLDDARARAEHGHDRVRVGAADGGGAAVGGAGGRCGSRAHFAAVCAHRLGMVCAAPGGAAAVAAATAAGRKAGTEAALQRPDLPSLQGQAPRTHLHSCHICLRR